MFFVKLKFFKKLFKNNGFTLIEIIIVSSLVFFMAVAALSSFVQAVKIYKKISVVRYEEDVLFFLEKITRDIKNGVYYSLIPFEGSETEISFASNSQSFTSDSDHFDSYPVSITYQYDRDKMIVVRIEDHHPFVNQAKVFHKEEILLKNMKAFSFNFETFGQAIPSKIIVDMEYGNERNLKNVKKVILVPKDYVSLI